MRIEDFPHATLRVADATIGAGVRIGPGTTIVADHLDLGAGASIGAACDLRSARLHLGPQTRIGDHARILAADTCHIATASVVDSDADIICRELDVHEQTYLGARLRIGLGAAMNEDSTVVIGSCCQIAPDVAINPTAPVTIGDHVGISPRVTLYTHGYHTGHPAAAGFLPTAAPITIAAGVWLAYDVLVLPGTTVGTGTQVAARAVITRSLPAGVLAAGVPARVKKPLAPRHLTPSEQATAVNALFSSWLQRLRYKGLIVQRLDHHCWYVTHPRTSQQWAVIHSPAPDRPSPIGLHPHTPRESHNGVLAGGLPVGTDSATHVRFDPPNVTGVLDILGHDLRDHCRRACWYLPYPANSTPLVPERFARLLNPRPALEPAP